MTAVRDTLCNLRPLEIPRPHVPGFQFITTRGRQGFYKSIRRDGAQYGIHIKSTGPRRPTLADAYWNFKDASEKSEGKEIGKQSSVAMLGPSLQPGQCNTVNCTSDKSHRSCQFPIFSDTSSKKLTEREPSLPEPDYDGPSDARKTTTTSERIENKKLSKGRTKFGGFSEMH